MSGLSTHILDTSRGTPAVGVAVTLERQTAGAAGSGAWSSLHSARTDADGRVKSLLPTGGTLGPGVHRLRFETRAYFAANGMASFYPYVEVVFEIADAGRHHHVPLLISPFGYSTYRGS